eukprot:scaffold1213_cov350-Prasinococcus_capsulatus_cf.AAC.7
MKTARPRRSAHTPTQTVRLLPLARSAQPGYSAILRALPGLKPPALPPALQAHMVSFSSVFTVDNVHEHALVNTYRRAGDGRARGRVWTKDSYRANRRATRGCRLVRTRPRSAGCRQ